MSPANELRPQLAGLQIADPPERWRALGFVVHEGNRIALGSVGVTLGGEGKGITGWTITGLDPAITSLDGLRTTPGAPSQLEPPRPASVHPNGATGLDHVVIATPDFDRTAYVLQEADLPLRRILQAPGGFRQGFRRLGPAILELVEVPQAPAGPARFWGLVVIVGDLDALAQRLQPHLTDPKPAVQADRRIATLRDTANLSLKVAFMDLPPRTDA
jgi:hypothetical protein